jgi:hypothetical protein
MTKISAYPEITIPTIDDLLIGTDVENQNETKNFSIQGLIDLAIPYKIYNAVLTQSGNLAPVATVLQNTLGGTIVWTRDSEGVYLGTLAGAFTTNKTLVQATNSTDKINKVVSQNVNYIQLSMFDTAMQDYTDGFTKLFLEVKVYN